MEGDCWEGIEACGGYIVIEEVFKVRCEIHTGILAVCGVVVVAWEESEVIDGGAVQLTSGRRHEAQPTSSARAMCASETRLQLSPKSINHLHF